MNRNFQYNTYCDFNDKNKDNCISFYLAKNKKIKNTNFLRKNVPIIILVRDPISRFKTDVNHGFTTPESRTKGAYSINDDIEKALDKIIYADRYGYKNYIKKPCLDKLQSKSEPVVFNYFSVTKFFKHQKEVIYIDTKDLMPENAFNTIDQLSIRFNFQRPKEKDKSIFEQKYWNKFAWFLPFFLVLKADEFGINNDIYITITDAIFKPDEAIDIKDILDDTKDNLFKEISINVNQEDFEIIKNNNEILDKLRIYFEKFIIILNKKAKQRQDSLINERDILNYFKENKKLADKFKKIFEYEFQDLRKQRPDIIDSWIYYKEFMKD